MRCGAQAKRLLYMVPRLTQMTIVDDQGAPARLESLTYLAAAHVRSSLDARLIRFVSFMPTASRMTRSSTSSLSPSLLFLTRSDPRSHSAAELSDVRESVKNHTSDVEKLRLKLLNEIPKVEKGLKNSDIAEARMLLGTMREKHARELDARREMVRETARLKDRMVSEEQRYQELTEAVAAQYDPNANSPRRNELRHKLQVRQACAYALGLLSDPFVCSKKGNLVSWSLWVNHLQRSIIR